MPVAHAVHPSLPFLPLGHHFRAQNGTSSHTLGVPRHLALPSRGMAAAGIARALAGPEHPAHKALAAPGTLEALRVGAPTAWRTVSAQLRGWVGPDTALGRHPYLSASGGVVGAVALVALLHDVYLRLPPQKQAEVRRVLRQMGHNIQAVGPYASSLLLAALASAMAQEGAVRWQEARHLSGAFMLMTSAPLGLSCVEILGSKLDIPVLRQAFSGIANYCNRHARDVQGLLLGASGIASAAFSTRMLAANNPWGWLMLAGALPATLGGTELIGREHRIAALSACLTGPVNWSIEGMRRVSSQNMAMQAVGAALALGGLWGFASGWMHLVTAHNGWGDALGAAQVTAGAVAAATGAGVFAQRRKWARSMQHVLENYNDAMSSAMMAAWGAGLTKHAVLNMAAFGPSYLNTGAAGLALGFISTGALAAFRQTQKKASDEPGAYDIVAPHMDARIHTAVDRVWALSGSLTTGAWSALVVRALLRGPRDSALLVALNAIPNIAVAALLGAASIGLLGAATNSKTLDRASQDIVDQVRLGTTRALRVAQKHPAPTLGALVGLVWLACQTHG